MTSQRIEPMRITIENENVQVPLVDASVADQTIDNNSGEAVIDLFSEDDEYINEPIIIPEAIPHEPYASKRSISKWFKAQEKYQTWIFPCSRLLDTIILSDSHLKMFDRKNVTLPGKSINAYSGAGSGL